MRITTYTEMRIMTLLPLSPLGQFLQDKLERLRAEAPNYKSGTREHAAWQAKLRRTRLAIARTKGTHTAEQWEALVAETGGICVRCGYQHDLNFEKPCKGYILPLAAGGSNAIDNLMPLCRACTRSKDMEAVNWLAAWRRDRNRPTHLTGVKSP